MIMEQGISPINDLIRAQIEDTHQTIRLHTISAHYDINTFNHCAEQGGLLLSLELWEDIHPGLVHVPLAVEEEIPCGFLYAPQPSPEAEAFLDAVRGRMAQE